MHSIAINVPGPIEEDILSTPINSMKDETMKTWFGESPRGPPFTFTFTPLLHQPVRHGPRPAGGQHGALNL